MRPLPVLAALLLLASCDLRYLAGIPAPTVRVAGAMPITLPFREAAGGLVLLTARVAGRHEVDFILDTGAPVTVLLDGPRTRALGLDTRDARKLGPADDPSSPVGVIRGGFHVAFGDVALEDLTAVVIPQASLPCAERFERVGFGGVVGADLFRRFVVEIDWRSRQLVLHEPSAWQAAPGATELPLHFESGHPHVDAVVHSPEGNATRARLHLDTGMNRALTLNAGEGTAFAMPPDGDATEECYAAGAVQARRGPPLALSLGGARFANVATVYSRQPKSSATRRTGAVGAGLLRERRIAVDYPGKRLWLLP